MFYIYTITIEVIYDAEQCRETFELNSKINKATKKLVAIKNQPTRPEYTFDYETFTGRQHQRNFRFIKIVVR